MSYDLRFQKGELWLLGGLSAAFALFLSVGSFLAGRMTVAGAAALQAAPALSLPGGAKPEKADNAKEDAAGDKEPAAVKDSGESTASPQTEAATASAATAPVTTPPVTTTPAAAAAAGVLPGAAQTAHAVKTDEAAQAAAPAVARSADASAAANGAATQAGAYTLQFGAFRDEANAKTLAKDLAEKGTKATVQSMTNRLGQPLSVVRFGLYRSTADALQAAHAQARALHTEVVVRPSDRL